MKTFTCNMMCMDDLVLFKPKLSIYSEYLVHCTSSDVFIVAYHQRKLLSTTIMSQSFYAVLSATPECHITLYHFACKHDYFAEEPCSLFVCLFVKSLLQILFMLLDLDKLKFETSHLIAICNCRSCIEYIPIL